MPDDSILEKSMVRKKSLDTQQLRNTIVHFWALFRIDLILAELLLRSISVLNITTYLSIDNIT